MDLPFLCAGAGHVAWGSSVFPELWCPHLSTTLAAASCSACGVRLPGMAVRRCSVQWQVLPDPRSSPPSFVALAASYACPHVSPHPAPHLVKSDRPERRVLRTRGGVRCVVVGSCSLCSVSCLCPPDGGGRGGPKSGAGWVPTPRLTLYRG